MYGGKIDGEDVIGFRPTVMAISERLRIAFLKGAPDMRYNTNGGQDKVKTMLAEVQKEHRQLIEGKLFRERQIQGSGAVFDLARSEHGLDPN